MKKGIIRIITGIVLLGIVYILLGIMMYKEKFSVVFVKVLGGVPLAIYVLANIAMSIDLGVSTFSLNFGTIILPVMFIYTSIVPIYNKTKKEEFNCTITI